MKNIFVGLGNPGEEHELSRHNAGRFVLETIAYKHGFSEWEEDRKLKALVTSGKIGKYEVNFVLPETYMNKSGETVKRLVKSTKQANKLVVVHDEIDMPLGYFKISFGRGDAGHNGLKSIIRAIGTKDFVRIRIGVSPKVRGSNKPKKPKGEKKVLDFLMGNFRHPEKVANVLLSEEIYTAMEAILKDGHERAMNEFN